MSFSHKPTGSKQVNKPFKSGKHRSKGELKRAAAGKVNQKQRQPLKSTTKQLNDTKAARKARSKQIAQNKRLAIIQRNRMATECPRTVAVVALSASVNVNVVADLLTQAIAADDAEKLKPSLPLPEGTVKLNGMTVTSPRFKSRLTIFPVKRELLAILDIAKVADIMLYVTSAADLVENKVVADEFGMDTVSIVHQQGCPDVIFALQGLDQVKDKLKHSCKKACLDFCTLQFKTNKPKVVPVDNVSDATQLLRFVCEQPLHQIKYRTKRPYMLVDAVRFVAYPQSAGDGKQWGSLMVSGYLKGNNLLPDNIVHITGYGDAQIEKITGGWDPYLHKKVSDPETMDGNEEVVLAVPTEKQESLERENPPDPFASEQAWPTPEELAEADEQMRTVVKRVPKGTSSYQAAWIPDLAEDEDDEDLSGEGDAEKDDFDIDIDIDKVAVPAATMEEEKGDREPQGGVQKPKKVTFNEENNEVFMADETKDEKKTLVEEEAEDEDFPDEVETPIDVPARIRFQKYRGLKSFRTSPWDPKENLPHDYSRIFQFENFRHTYKRIYEQEAKCPNHVQPGQYVTIHLKNISSTQFASFPEGYPMVVCGLHKYENKMSVVNFAVHRVSSYTDPVKAKTPVLMQVGFRRYSGNPIYSDNNLMGDKFKICKFFRGSAVASFYAPITLPPSPVLMFGGEEGNFGRLIAFGQLHSVSPDRILLKKILLSGLPFRVLRNKARVKQMFYSPEDVRWFKPVELWTKHGLSGRIVEALGTHGNMKCVFDGSVGQQDSVMMSLYKRVFPKWVTLPELEHPEKQ